MIGQKSIIDLRLQGLMPAQCWVMLHDETPEFRDWYHPEMLMQNDMAPEVHVGPSEIVDTLDFRFLRGIVAHIAGGEMERSIRCLRRIAAFEPAKAICAGDGWMVGWKAGYGFINFLQKKAA